MEEHGEKEGKQVRLGLGALSITHVTLHVHSSSYYSLLIIIACLLKVTREVTFCVAYARTLIRSTLRNKLKFLSGANGERETKIFFVFS